MKRVRFTEADREEAYNQIARECLSGFIWRTLPNYQMGWVHEEICNELDRFLQDVIDGKSPRLMLTMPPRHGKSEIASRRFPAYALGRYPDISIISTSYASDLASRINRDVQRIMDDDVYARIFPDTKLNGKNSSGMSGAYIRNSDIFEVVGHNGVYRSSGVGGGITGMGGECVTEDTKIATPCGNILAKNILAGMPVIAYNHTTKKTEICMVEAVKERYAESIYELHSNKGRSLKVTGNHPVYSRGKYIPASTIAESTPIVCGMWQRVYNHGVSVQKENTPRAFQRFLFKRMFSILGKQNEQRTSQVRQMWAVVQKREQILRNLFAYCQRMEQGYWHKASKKNLSCLSSRVFGCASWQKSFFNILFDGVQKQGTFYRNAGQNECAFQRVCDRKKNTGKGSLLAQERSFQEISLLRFVQWCKKFASASCRFRPCEQCYQQSCGGMQRLSYGNSQARSAWGIRTEIITKNQKISYADGIKVIDIQVSKCHNFFANGVLVHNCLIIDDPFKDRAEADSPTIREKVWDWYTSTLYTRLAPGGGIILIQTRWHTDDLAGRLLQAEASGDGDKWRVVNFPAIAEADEPHRKQGEALHPERYPLEQLLKIKAAIGTRDWEALYQQHPTPEGGTIFHEEWLKYWLPKDLPNFDQMVLSWDMTFKEGDASDFVVGQAWGRKGGDFYLVDQMRGRWGFTDTMEQFKRLAEKYPQATRKLVEDKANGPAVIDSLKHHISGIIPVEPDGSKVARAHAVTALFEAGNVYIPDPSLFPWVWEYITELTQFPSVAHDDQVDATTQALRHFGKHPGMNINADVKRKVMLDRLRIR